MAVSAMPTGTTFGIIQLRRWTERCIRGVCRYNARRITDARASEKSTRIRLSEFLHPVHIRLMRGAASRRPISSSREPRGVGARRGKNTRASIGFISRERDNLPARRRGTERVLRQIAGTDGGWMRVARTSS